MTSRSSTLLANGLNSSEQPDEVARRAWQHLLRAEKLIGGASLAVVFVFDYVQAPAQER
jgi:hypothetical protein